MGTTITLRDVVGIAEDIFLVGLVPLHGEFNTDIVLFGRELEHLFMHRRLFAIEMLDKGLDTAFIFKNILLVAAFVFQDDAHTRIEEREFPQTLCEDIVVIFSVRENFRTRPETNRRTGLVSITDDFERLFRNPQVIFLVMDMPLAINRELELVRQRIHDRDTNTVKPA